MDLGIHLPQIGFGETEWSLEALVDYVSFAERLGFRFLCANDHLLFSRPWLDGPTALAAVSTETDMRLATTIANPVVRDPVVLAKALDALDLLSGGNLDVGVGPGSSARDYAAVGLDFEERWPRFDEAVRALRSLLHRDGTFEGEFYSTDGVELEPRAAQRPGPPIWIGSWGSRAGLRRVARLGDGWLASGYNTTPEGFAASKTLLEAELLEAGRDPEGFPTALATVFFYVTDDTGETDRILRTVLGPTLDRSVEELTDRLPVGPAEACADCLGAYAEAGLDRLSVWPVENDLEQLQRFGEEVVPAVDGETGR